MTEHGRGVVIIGNGVAGNAAAAVIRKVDSTTPITMISQETDPEYSACVLSKKYICGEIEREDVFLKKAKDYEKQNIKTVFGQLVTRIDTNMKKVILRNQNVSYDKLIISMGGNPVIPPLEGVGKRGIFTLKSLADADTIFRCRGRKAVVIGGGAIGVEASISLRKRGFHVVLIELLDRILPTMFDGEASSIMRKRLEDFGIEIHTREKAMSFRGNDDVCCVNTQKREVDCDMVILSLGIKPNIEIAKDAGAEIGSLGGIVADEYMQTNLRDVFACGDCVETRDRITGNNMLFLFWYNARQQGKIAGYNAVGIRKKFLGNIAIGTVDVLGSFGVSIGHTRDSFSQGNVEVIEGGDTWYHRVVISDGVFVGAQLIGKTNDIGPIVTAVRKRDTQEKLQSMLYDGHLLALDPSRVKLYQYLDKAFL